MPIFIGINVFELSENSCLVLVEASPFAPLFEVLRALFERQLSIRVYVIFLKGCFYLGVETFSAEWADLVVTLSFLFHVFLNQHLLFVFSNNAVLLLKINFIFEG